MHARNYPTLWRRLAAIVYDLLLLTATLMLATLIALPFAQSDHFTTQSYLYQSYLLLVIFAFYTWFWCHGGQTIGMLAWDLKLSNHEQQTPNIAQASLRFLYACLTLCCFGAGLWWSCFDRKKQTLYDRWSKIQMIRVTPPRPTDKNTTC